MTTIVPPPTRPHAVLDEDATALILEAVRHLDSAESVASTALFANDPELCRDALEHAIRSNTRARQLVGWATHLDLTSCAA